MFTLRNVAEESCGLQQRIRRMLESQDAMSMDELSVRLGVDVATVRQELWALIARGDVERLHPIGYSGEEHDFFRMDRPAVTAGWAGGWVGRRMSRALREEQARLRWPDKVMACFIS